MDNLRYEMSVKYVAALNEIERLRTALRRCGEHAHNKDMGRYALEVAIAAELDAVQDRQHVDGYRDEAGKAVFPSDYISPEDQLQFFREKLRTVSIALRTAEKDLAIAREAITNVTTFSAASHRELEAKLANAEQKKGD